MSKVGFTGTQIGMTPEQVTSVFNLLYTIEGVEFHHGDCVGSDESAHIIARELNYRIVIHPPKISSKRAFCQGDETKAPEDYIKRNHNIVDDTEILIATPKTIVEEVRSGTWATVRYARKANRKVIIVYPDGTIN